MSKTNRPNKTKEQNTMNTKTKTQKASTRKCQSCGYDISEYAKGLTLCAACENEQDGNEELGGGSAADKSAHTPTADEYVCWQHKGWCKGQRTRKAIDCDCFDEAGQTFYSHHTQQEHEESGCTDYLQHNADSCPHLTTPPPWKAFKYPDCKTWTVAARQSVASKIQREPDARLIAAAPDLLEACKMVQKLVNQMAYTGGVVEELDPFGNGIKQIDAAIAKAEGQ